MSYHILLVEVCLEDIPVSQICALTVLPSTLIERVANSTPIVDLDSRLNSLRVKRESTEIEADNQGRLRQYCMAWSNQTVSLARHIQFLESSRYQIPSVYYYTCAYRDSARTICRHQSHQSALPMDDAGIIWDELMSYGR
jgi:hypothetical protein